MRDGSKNVPARLGEVIITTAGALRAKYVFHAITIGDGPLTPQQIVAQSTRRCLELLQTLGLRSIAFPAIGAGAAGFAYQDVAVQMAHVIVDCLKESPQSVDVTIFLYDRFRRMQPIDYIGFFEQFAVRTGDLGPPLKGAKRTRYVSGQSRGQPGPRAPKQEKRRRLIEKLGDLDRERQQLEAQLAEYKDTLTEDELSRVEERIDQVHRERVDVLSEVKAPVFQQRVSVFVS